MNTSDFTENRFLKLIDNIDQRGTSQSDGVPFSPFRPFEDLSMKERAAVIRIGVQNGLRDLESIRSKYNEYADGGSIHIKPENRGKFTALKERTGYSASWFKAHGTPAQRKMATFALNSRHWKHGDGGYLFDEGGETNEEYYPIWLDGITVKPSGNRPTTRDDWNWANWRELQNKREQQAAESVRRGIDRNGTPIAAGIYALAAAPFAIEGLGSSAVANGVRTGLQAMNTAFTPSTWLNPVTGARLLSPTVGTVADAGVQGAFAYEGLNGLYNQGREGTLLSDPASTFMHGLEVLPLVGLGSKAIGSAYRNLANSNVVKNRGFALPINNTLYWVGKGLGSEISLAPGTEGYMRVSDVLSKSPGTGRKLYDAAIKYAQNNGYRGIESGNMLLSAPKTYSIWEHYPNRQLLGNYGMHNNFNMASYGELDNVGSVEDMVANTANGIPTKFEGAPVYGLTEPSVETITRTKRAYGTPKTDIISIEDNDTPIGSPQTSTDEFIELLKSRTGKNVTRKSISEVPSRSDIYTHGYSYVDDEGNEIAHIFGNKQRGNVYVEDSFVSPDYRSSGIGKKMYFDFNEKIYDELGRPLRSSPFQHQFTMKDPKTGILVSPSSRLWKGLKDNGMARTIGSGFNWEYVMEPPSVIKRKLNPTRIVLEEPAARLRRNQSMIMNYYNNAQSNTFNNALNYANNLNNTKFYSKLNDIDINDYIFNTKFTKKYGGPLVEMAMGGRLKHKNKKNKGS